MPDEIATALETYQAAALDYAMAEDAEDAAHKEYLEAKARWEATTHQRAQAAADDAQAHSAYIAALRAHRYVDTASGPAPAPFSVTPTDPRGCDLHLLANCPDCLPAAAPADGMHQAEGSALPHRTIDCSLDRCGQAAHIRVTPSPEMRAAVLAASGLRPGEAEATLACHRCGRVPGAPSAPCPGCADYNRGPVQA